MSMTNDVQKVLPTFFAEAGGVIGAEKTYHALFTHHLFAAGAPLGTVGWEVALNGRARVDVVLFDPAARGDFACTDLARVAIEFKGGAYDDRNAMRDTVRLDRNLALRTPPGLVAGMLTADLGVVKLHRATQPIVFFPLGHRQYQLGRKRLGRAVTDS